MSDYEIAFSGQIQPDADPQQVRVNLGKLFRVDAKRIEALFCGRRMVIKSALDSATAEKYRATLERAGALVDVVKKTVTDEVRNTGNTSDPSPRATSHDSHMAAFSHIKAPDFAVAAVGDDLQDSRKTAVAPVVDLSQFSLAPPGSDMGELKPDVPAVLPDISHLQLQ